MTERDEPYTPSVDEVREAWAKRNAFYRASSGLVLANDAKYSAEDYAEVDRMIAALVERTRAEEREKAARIAERMVYDGGHRIAARIREQGKEQDR